MKKILHLCAITLFVSVFSQPLFAADTTKDQSSADKTSTSNTTTSTDTSKTNGTTTTSSTDASTKQANKKTISMSNLLQQLQKSGYIVTNIEFDKDNAAFKAEAIDRHGDKQSLDINAVTGLTPDQKKTTTQISIAQAAKKLEKNGNYIKSVSADTNVFKVIVVDSKGNSQDVTVDMQTGKVSQ